MPKVRRGGQLNPVNQFSSPQLVTTNPLRLLNPLFVLRRNALYRSLAGDRGWMAVAAVVWGPVLLRRALGKRPERVAIEPLAIGHVLRLAVLPQDTKVERKAYRRTK
jgi:hypothetical protein